MTATAKCGSAPDRHCGMRKKAKVQDKLEKLSVADALRAVDFAEVVVLLLDATLGWSHRICASPTACWKRARPADRAQQMGRGENPSSLFNGVRKALEDGLSQVKGVPLLAVSAATGKGLDTLIEAAFETRAAWSKRVPTGELNRWFERAVEANPPPAPGGKRIKLRYVTQVKSRPPSFVIFGTGSISCPPAMNAIWSIRCGGSWASARCRYA